LIAGLSVLIAVLWPTLRDQPGAIEAMRRVEELQIDVQRYFYISAALFAFYSAANIVLALTLRSGRRGPVMSALLWTGLVTGFLALNVLAGLSQGNVPSLLVALLVLAAHGVLINWLLHAKRNLSHGGPRRNAVAPFPIPPQPVAPMAGYYAPLPPPPESRARTL
jgi:fatty acid desaturase